MAGHISAYPQIYWEIVRCVLLELPVGYAYPFPNLCRKDLKSLDLCIFFFLLFHLNKLINCTLCNPVIVSYFVFVLFFSCCSASPLSYVKIVFS